MTCLYDDAHQLLSFEFKHIPSLLPEPSNAMLTELCLSADEFDHFAVRAQSSVTFCLKELRVRWWTGRVT